MRRLTGWARLGVLGGLTAVFVAYFLVWLPGPAAGLQFMGVELGEWVKFTGVGWARNYFYVPPLTLGCMVALLSVGMENGRKRPWLLRGVGVAVSLLAWPALAIIINEPPSEWLLRLLLIGGVLGVSLLAAVPFWHRVPWLLPWLFVALGLLGGIAPTRFYLILRPHVASIFGQPLGVGAGVWLNGVGHLLVAAIFLWQWGWGAKNEASQGRN